jgi:hypothetical protein
VCFDFKHKHSTIHQITAQAQHSVLRLCCAEAQCFHGPCISSLNLLKTGRLNNVKRKDKKSEFLLKHFKTFSVKISTCVENTTKFERCFLQQDLKNSNKN